MKDLVDLLHPFHNTMVTRECADITKYMANAFQMKSLCKIANDSEAMHDRKVVFNASMDDKFLVHPLH